MNYNRIHSARPKNNIKLQSISFNKGQQLKICIASHKNLASQRRSSKSHGVQRERDSSSNPKIAKVWEIKSKEQYSLQIDAIYTELEDELIQLKNNLIVQIQDIMAQDHGLDQVKKIKLAGVLTKARRTAAQIKMMLCGTDFYPSSAGQSPKARPNSNRNREEIISAKIAQRITQVLLEQQ